MKSRAEQLEKMCKAILIASNRIRYYKQQDKMLQSEIKRLTRNERTHRLCTRGGMMEAFIREPEKLTDDQVMELMAVAFRRRRYQRFCRKCWKKRKSKDAIIHLVAANSISLASLRRRESASIPLRLLSPQSRNDFAGTPVWCPCALRGLLQRARWRKAVFSNTGDAALPLRRYAATLLRT